MSRKKWSLLVVALIGVVILAFTDEAESDKNEPPADAGKEVIQEFPSNDKLQTAWKVRWDSADGFGLIVKGAWFKRHPDDKWIQVLGDARVVELLIAYHQGWPRFANVSYNFPLCYLDKEAAGPNGTLLGSRPNVMKEVRDRGVAWMTGEKVRRGQSLVLCAALSVANYRPLIEYGFQDDGTITFRVGNTGCNYPTREWASNTQNIMWRVDVNLDGGKLDSAYVNEHKSSQELAAVTKDIRRPFNAGKEGGEDWIPSKFTSLRFVNAKKTNAKGDPWSYELISRRSGNSRLHGLRNETWTHHDFWITRKMPINDGRAFDPSVHLSERAKAAESIMDTDIVLWHNTPMVHDPSSEDGEMKGKSFDGATRVTWVGFDLRPRNFFDRSPLYP